MKKNQTELISPELFKNAVLNRSGALGDVACQVMATAVSAVNAYQCVRDNVWVKGDRVQFGNSDVDLNKFHRVFLVGFGKASAQMAKALLDQLGDRIDLAKVITKDEIYLTEQGYSGKLQVLIGDHPVPGEQSLEASRALLDDLSSLDEHDLVLVVISGGGSSLFTFPVSGISLADVQAATQVLLRSGAEITEINTIRKHLDRVKGGQLARVLFPAEVHTLILSDVVGDRLDMIASGPTAPDPTTFSDALEIIQKYDLWNDLPKTIVSHLKNGRDGKIQETPKPGDRALVRIQNHLVGTNLIACQAAKRCAEELGYESEIVSSQLTGLTQNVAEVMKNMIRSVIELEEPIKPPCCIIFGGETTVEVKGEGLGGRNQDLALHMVRTMSEYPETLFISLATDGEDGPTDAAGAVVDSEVLKNGEQIQHVDLNEMIRNNDSYHYFQKTGGLIKIGPTGTNVNDLILLFIDQK